MISSFLVTVLFIVLSFLPLELYISLTFKPVQDMQQLCFHFTVASDKPYRDVVLPIVAQLKME